VLGTRTGLHQQLHDVQVSRLRRKMQRRVAVLRPHIQAQSEMVTLQLFKSYCLPFTLYATEVMPLSERLVQSLDRCVRQVVANIFATQDNNCIKEIMSFCDLPDIGVLIERRRVKFVDKMLTNGQYVFIVGVGWG